ncbi:MAG: FG-GAP and VCBS repeat-containing protein, partial [Flavobacteriales bacterium]
MNLPSFQSSYLKTLALTGLVLVPVFGYLIWTSTTAPVTLTTLTDDYAETGTQVKQDLELHPALSLTETDDAYTATDTKDGIDIQFANQTETLKTDETPKLNVTFPKDYTKPLEVKLDDKRTIRITDLGGKADYQADTLALEAQTPEQTGESTPGFWQNLSSSLTPKSNQQKASPHYLRYTSRDDRKSLLYAFQKDQASGEKQLKHWTLYRNGSGQETESYQFENAKVRLNNGQAEVYYFGEQDLQKDQVAVEVDSNLMARAQRTLAKEMGDDLLSGSHTPDFTIPAPYYVDQAGEQHEASWQWSEESKTLSVSFAPVEYPVALDPTLSFTTPGQSNTGSVITGEASSQFGVTMVAGDFNADGKMDLAVGGGTYASSTGRVYIFYNDGNFSSNAIGADYIITGNGVAFGNYAIGSGDLNADGRTDLIVSAGISYTSTGIVYLFYNDGSMPMTAATADVTITGENIFDSFGVSVTTADFNFDGRADLAVGAYGYSSSTGRAYIFYNDGSIPTTAATADVTITGETTSNYFGFALASGDWNA